ncbi:hypothetical protein [Rhodococcus sovatensis]|uniref:Uncharacterized protein n=1 Tax=Rhodococcus sovatensis TaxID=1805840 RepID=A0ABZ2PKC7_9NOCA
MRNIPVWKRSLASKYMSNPAGGPSDIGPIWVRRGMFDEEGTRVTDDDVLDNVRDMGAAVVRCGPVESLDLQSWRRQLRAQAKARGFRIHVRKSDDVVVVSDPDHVVDRRRMRAAVEAVSRPSDLGPL